nr:family 78 glycoside hydrolase catalytic domain [Candidatus Sigynarchaeota archaeon]
MQVHSLRVEFLSNPEGIDVVAPRLSWVVESATRGDNQTGYQVLVATSEDRFDEAVADLWDTGRVPSNQTINVIYGGKPLKTRDRCVWKVRAWDAAGKPTSWSEIARWSMGLLAPEDWKAKWIGSPPRNIRRRAHIKQEIDPSPLLRKAFSIEKSIKHATFYITALGEYEASINGHRVGDHVLAPEYTDYHKRVQYQAYDVTSLLREGENVIGAMLADGWYIGNIGFGNVKFFIKSRMYGVNRRLLAQLIIEYSDGSTSFVLTGQDWKIWEDGPVRRADHYLGEIYDTRKEQSGWDAPGFDDSSWLPVTIDDTIHINIVAQMNESIRVVKQITPVAMSEPNPGVFIFNLGQNIAGWCILRLNGSQRDANATVKVRHGEMLDLDGSLYTTNLSVARAEDVYMLGGNEDRELHPRFTYHGFQYVEVTGLKQGTTPSLDMVTGCAVASDPLVISTFECSDPSLNRLWQNIFWTLRDNIISIPTDCPQRSERLGWMGDAQVFSQPSMMIMDMAAFYTKWVKDIRDAQFEDGRFSDISPNPFMKGGAIIKFRGAPAWADCGVLLPWDMYLNYHDTRGIEVHYSSAKRFVDQVLARNPNLLWKKDKGVIDFGDWLNGSTIKAKGYPRKGGMVPKDVHATIFLARSAQLLGKMAAILGKTADAEQYASLADRIKKAFLKSYVDKDGRIKGDTQAGYALALHFDILPDDLRPKAVQHLIEALERYDHRLSTGFNSTTRMMLELARWGNVAIAYKLLFSRRFPSWFYMIDQGATTMWERWDGFVKGRGFQSKLMNSFCHYSYGSIGEFIIRVVLGINLDEDKPGYEHFIVQPRPSKQFAKVKGTVTTIRGTIASEWTIDRDQLDFRVTVPANTTATVVVPVVSEEKIHESGVKVVDVQGIHILGMDHGSIRLHLVPGTYHFTSTINLVDS